MPQKLQNSPAKPKYLAWLIWFLGISIFFIEYIIRTSPLVMFPQLINDFNASYTQISSFSALFLYAYVSMQVPVGMIVDKFGIRISLTVSSILCATSTIIFASTHYILLAQLSRFIFGIGAAFAFVSTLKLAANWFSPRLFSILVGITQAVGMIGGAVGASIVGRLLNIYDWRDIILVVAIILGAIAITVAVIVRDSPSKEIKDEDLEISIGKGLKKILKHKQTWLISLCAGFMFTPTGVFAELWGSYFLQTSHNIAGTDANDAVAMIYIGWAIGGPLAGVIANYIGRKKTIMLSCLSGCIIIPLIIYSPKLSLNLLCLLFFLYGLFNSGTVAAYTAVAELQPSKYKGIALGFSNGMSVVIAAICIQIIGVIQDIITNHRTAEEVAIYAAQDIRLIMSVTIIAVFIALIISFFTKETYLQNKD